MANMYIMKGLPASGKTTKAMEILASNGDAIRVNKDELRLMLHGNRKWNFKQEKSTNKLQTIMIQEALASGKSVIVDDTNLNPNRLQILRDLAKGHKIVEIVMDTSYETCLSRDMNRSKSVGKNVIERMAIRNGMFPYANKFVLCDLDGTIADLSHRLKYLEQEPKDYRTFYNDFVVAQDGFYEETWNAVKTFSEDNEAEVVFFSGRSSSCRSGTLSWITEHTGIFDPVLFMRSEGDKRPDHVVKKEMYHQTFKTGDVIRVFDDRPSVIRMWRDLGLDVIDCGDGNEF